MINLPLPRAIIFDWDNTLVDSWDAIMKAMNNTLQHFDKSPWTMEEVHQRCVLAGRDYFPGIFGNEWEKAFEIYYQHFNAIRSEHATKPRPGADDLLGWLKSFNIPAFVVSNKNGKYLRQEAEALGWRDFFVSLVGATDAPENKPARAPVDMALNRGGLTPDASIWFVGDTDVDIQCAHNSGCTPIFVGEKEKAEKFRVAYAFADCLALHDQLKAEAARRNITKAFCVT